MNKVLALLGVVVVAVIVYTTMGPQTDGGASDADVAQTSTDQYPFECLWTLISFHSFIKYWHENSDGPLQTYQIDDL